MSALIACEATASCRPGPPLEAPGELPTSCLVKIHPACAATGPIELCRAGLIIGRDSDCDVSLADDSVSRQHARIEACGDRYVVVDLGSKNGTFVNDHRVEEQTLAAGDRLRLGNQIFKFLSASDLEAQYHETVYQMMTTDGLTGVSNKRLLLEVLKRETTRAMRHGRPLAVALFDVDHFKRINDSLGHLAGDEVLQELSRRAAEVLRQDELLARYGGEEFAILMCEVRHEQARGVAERVRQAIANSPFVTEQGLVEVSISLGVAVYPGQGTTSPSLLLKQADDLLYAAKRAGRNRVCSE